MIPNMIFLTTIFAVSVVVLGDVLDEQISDVAGALTLAGAFMVTFLATRWRSGGK